MRFSIILSLVLLPALLIAQGPDDGVAIKTLIKSLASSDFRQRQAAMKALRDRPEAALELRDALRSPVLETRKRAAEILDFYDLRPVRNLKAAVKDMYAADSLMTELAEAAVNDDAVDE